MVGNTHRFALSLSVLSLLGACASDLGVEALKSEIVVTPTTVEFGTVIVGETKASEVAIRNVGDAVLSISSIEAIGLGGEYVFECAPRACDGLSLAPSERAVLTVRFAPLTETTSGGTIRINSDASNGPTTDITVSGTGALLDLEVNPRNLAFGTILTGTSESSTVEVTNRSTSVAVVNLRLGTNVKYCSGPAADTSVFCIQPAAPVDAQSNFTLSPNETMSIAVTFTPEIIANENGTLTFRGCDSCPEINVTLSGSGTETGFACEPAAIDFGAVNPGSCVTRQTTCTNLTQDELTVIDWRMAAGTSSADLTTVPFTGPHTLAAAETVEVGVQYCPDALSEDEGTLIVETNAQDVRLQAIGVPVRGSGGGPDISVMPAKIDFGAVSLLAPARRVVQISNLGFSDLSVTSIQPLSATSDFSVSTVAEVIPPGDFRILVIEFQPSAEGLSMDEILVVSDDADTPEVRIQVQGTGMNLPPCQFELAPTALEFGAVPIGHTTSRALEIRNIGASDCLITGARISSGAPTFTVPNVVQSEIIPAGSSTNLVVEFAPDSEGRFIGDLEFSISSPSSPFNTVVLSGTGADGALLIVPRDLDFGVIGVGCAARQRTVTIYNTGAAAAQITSIEFAANSNPAFTLIDNNPEVLAPGASMSFDVGFNGGMRGAYAGAIEIAANVGGAAVEYIVSVQGRADTNAVQVDEFQQLERPAADIMFVVDNSCSMSEEQTALAANFNSFIQFAVAQGLDYHIAVTTTDIPREGGRFVPVGDPDRVVTPRTQPSPEQIFGRNVQVGINGSANEQPLEAAYRALSSPIITGANAGFLRREAVLSLIFVTDEADQSPQSVAFYTNFFRSIKGFRNPNLFSASVISGGLTGCSAGAGRADSDTRITAVAMDTAGISLSICTMNWASSLEDLATTAFGFKSNFILSHQAVPNTVRVYVDEVEVPAVPAGGGVNWQYVFSTNSVNFGPFAIPEPGAHIRITYEIDCL